MFKHFLSYQGASSICMALSFALYCHPQQILLFGCDCSLDKDDKYHSKGTFHSYNHDDNKSGRYVLVKKNQNQNDFVKTTEELLSYKKSIEVILRQRQSMIKVYNLSGTGAYIEGSIPWSLERIKLNNKKHKSKGLAVLKNAFRAFKEGDNWYKFKNNSQELLDKYKKELIDKLMRQPKNWVELLEQLDFTAFEVYLKFRIGKNDGRLGIYMSLINSYLMIVYMYLLKFENFDDAILFYNQSIHYLSVKLSSLNWPNELDGF